MFISFHPSLAGASQVKWPESLYVAQRAGFAAIDVQVQDMVEDGASAVRDNLASAGLRIGGAPLPLEFRQSEAVFAQGLMRLPELARFASEIGVTVMGRTLPASSAVPKGEMLPVIRRRLEACLRVLEPHGIRLALEFIGPLHMRRGLPHEFIWRIDETVDFVASLGEGAGLLLDAWHWHHVGGTRLDLKEISSLVLQVQVADAPDVPPEAIRDDQRLLPGAGIIDLAGFLGILSQEGYRGPVTPEVFGYRCDSLDPVDCARGALDATSRVMRSLNFE